MSAGVIAASYDAASGGVGGFDPRSIPGLVAWYSAENESGKYADGALVTTWHDLSGLGHDAPLSGGGTAGTGPTFSSTGGPGNGARLFFNNGSGSGNGRFFIIDGLITGATAIEMHTEIQASSSTAISGSWYNGNAGGPDHCLYPYSDGVVYEELGRASGSRVSFTPTLGIDSWRHYNVWSTTGDFAARLDGITQVTATTGTFAVGSQLWIGCGTNDSVAFRFSGSMSLFLLYNRKLTATERTNLDSWIQAHPNGGMVA